MSRSTPAPRVMVDVRKLNDSGIGTYIRNVVARVTPLMPDVHFDLLGDPNAVQAVFGRQANIQAAPCAVAPLSLKEQFLLPRYIPRNVDLYWATHFNIPLAYRGPLLTTIHDIMPMALRERSGNRIHEYYVRLMMARLRARRTPVIAVSQFTKAELTRLAGLPPEQVIHTPLGVDDLWRRIEPRVRPHPKPYLLYVGLVKPHKNLLTLLRAFAQARSDIPHDLVIVGDRNKINTRDTASVDFAERLGERVLFTGFVAHDVLEQYFASADALVFPSLYEGFGLPAAEAMASGCPVIASRAASLPEVCGNAAVYFDPRDAADIARAVVRVAGDPALREQMRRLGRERAQGMQWSCAAQRTADAIRVALQGAPS